MSRLTFFFHRRSLTFALVALFLGMMAFSDTKMLSIPREHRDLLPHVIICIVSVMVCVAAWINLVLDGERGYSPNRCQLASVMMLAASVGPLGLVLKLARLLF